MTSHHDDSSHPSRRAALRAWAILTCAGLVGVASLIPYIRDTLANLGPDTLPVSLPTATALALLQSSIVTALP